MLIFIYRIRSWQQPIQSNYTTESKFWLLHTERFRNRPEKSQLSVKYMHGFAVRLSGFGGNVSSERILNSLTLGYFWRKLYGSGLAIVLGIHLRIFLIDLNQSRKFQIWMIEIQTTNRSLSLESPHRWINVTGTRNKFIDHSLFSLAV